MMSDKGTCGGKGSIEMILTMASTVAYQRKSGGAALMIAASPAQLRTSSACTRRRSSTREHVDDQCDLCSDGEEGEGGHTYVKETKGKEMCVCFCVCAY